MVDGGSLDTLTIYTTPCEKQQWIGLGNISKIILNGDEVVTEGASGTLYVEGYSVYYKIDDREEYEGTDIDSPYMDLYDYVDYLLVSKIVIDNIYDVWTSEFMTTYYDFEFADNAYYHLTKK